MTDLLNLLGVSAIGEGRSSNLGAERRIIVPCVGSVVITLMGFDGNGCSLCQPRGPTSHKFSNLFGIDGSYSIPLSGLPPFTRCAGSKTFSMGAVSETFWVHAFDLPPCFYEASAARVHTAFTISVTTWQADRSLFQIAVAFAGAGPSLFSSEQFALGARPLGSVLIDANPGACNSTPSPFVTSPSLVAVDTSKTRVTVTGA